MFRLWIVTLLSVPLVLIGGCATVRLNEGFSDVSAAIERQSGLQLFWNNGTDLDREAAEKLGALLKTKLTMNDAIQIALLNNRDLQAVYSDLGVAQADLVQAGLLSNPVFDAAIKRPAAGGGKPDLELSVVMNFLDVFYLPLRKRVAAARFEEAKSRISGAVLDFAGRIRTAFVSYQANEQNLELRRTIVQALAASFEVSRRRYEAGNVTDLDFARERAQVETGKLALRSSEVATRQSREQLNVLMGLWGAQTGWQADDRLPEVPANELEVENIERVALEGSVDVLNARQRVISAGEQLGMNRATALLPESHLGALGERRDGAWEVGPVIEFPIPLFDQNQARTARAAAEFRRAQQEYYALAVTIRGRARAIEDRAQGARDRALYYRDIVLPLHEQIVHQAQLQYNAMQIGSMQLLLARQQQIEAALSYVEALRDYWLARADLTQLLSGRLPDAAMQPAPETAPMRRAGPQGRNPEAH
jgi:cobalt-zinc-cadmium efflux system outer membrane protein